MESIETYFPDTMRISNAFKSFAYQPERVSLNSQDDITGGVTGTFSYSGFTIRLARPCLNVKSIQLLRCSIPTPVPSFNDNELVFWYYRLPTPDAPKSIADLAFIRLIPSTWLSSLFPYLQVGSTASPGSDYGYNRSFQSYDDLVAELNLACLQDLCLGKSPATTPNFYSGDIEFGYDQRTNRIYFTGKGPYYYVPVSYNDDILKNPAVKANFLFLTQNPPVDANIYQISTGQPYNPDRPLSLRLGWSWDNQQYENSEFLVTGQGVKNYANTYADLVYSANCYLYVDFIGASSLDSAGNSGLLSVVPLNTANNAVGFYNNIMAVPLTKIPTQISELRIMMKDDAGNDFALPNSAIVNLEVGFTYH